MRQLKLVGVALVAISAFLIVTATSAFAAEVKLPSVHVLSGETYPLHLNFADNGKTAGELETAAGGRLEGKGVLVLLLTTELSALGLFDALFLKVTLFKTVEPCSSTGDAKGEVLLEGAFHVVPISLSPLELGVAFLLLKELTIECTGGLKIKVRGCALSSLEKLPAESEDTTEVGGSLLTNGKGDNKLINYFGDKEEKLKCALESNEGVKFVLAGENIGEQIVLKALPPEVGGLPKMFSILNR
jgi:hypothetical protein